MCNDVADTTGYTVALNSKDLCDGGRSTDTANVVVCAWIERNICAKYTNLCSLTRLYRSPLANGHRISYPYETEAVILII